MVKSKVKKEVTSERVLNMKIPKELHRLIRLKAADLDISIKDVVMEALEKHLKIENNHNLKISDQELRELEELEEPEED